MADRDLLLHLEQLVGGNALCFGELVIGLSQHERHDINSVAELGYTVLDL